MALQADESLADLEIELASIRREHRQLQEQHTALEVDADTQRQVADDTIAALRGSVEASTAEAVEFEQRRSACLQLVLRMLHAACCMRRSALITELLHEMHDNAGECHCWREHFTMACRMTLHAVNMRLSQLSSGMHYLVGSLTTFISAAILPKQSCAGCAGGSRRCARCRRSWMCSAA